MGRGAGSGFRVKGLDRAVRSLAALPEAQRAHARLVVIGQNRPMEFELLARKLGVVDRVHFLGGRDDVWWDDAWRRNVRR